MSELLRTPQPELDLESLEERKLKEIEHSRVRRSVLQGFERRSDTHASEEADGLDALIRDREAYQYHFANAKFYAITQESEAFQHDWLKQRCRPGSRVLDFACGSGENGIYAAQCGADTIGIDISPEGVENANLNAVRAGVSGHCRFLVMDGEDLKFEDNSFDVGVEYGALHHVDLPRAAAELARVLTPRGEMVCVEALRHNPLIHWYRKRTPHLRTAWEVDHILGVEHLAVLRRHFVDVEVRFFHLAVLAAVPFRKTRAFEPLRKALDVVDRFLLSRQIIGKYTWIMVVMLGRPKK